MPKPAFPAKQIREALKPRMTQNEMARRMGISGVYLSELESGLAGIPFWPEHRKKDFMREIEAWKNNPDDKPRKYWGRRKGHRADGTPVPPKRVLAVA